MNWLWIIPKRIRRALALGICLMGGAIAVVTRDAWGLVVIWAGVNLAFVDYLVDDQLLHPEPERDVLDDDWFFG